MNVTYNVAELKKMVDDICTLTGVAMSITDTKYNTLYENHSMCSEFCSLVQSCPGGLEKCRRCDLIILDSAKNSKEPCSHICHAGLRDTGVPIIKGGVTVGYIIIGRIRETEVLDGSILEALAGYGLGREELALKYEKNVSLSDEQLGCLLRLLSRILLEHAIDIDYDSFINRATDFIDENLASPLGVKELCARLFVSKNYLYKSFRSFFGKTVNEYIADRRVRRAAELLLSSSKSALEIAADVGVENYTYFTKLFKRKMGFSPSQYRKIQHKNPV